MNHSTDDRRARWTSRRVLVATAATLVVAAAVVLLVGAFVGLQSDGPDSLTADTYGDLFDNRDERDAVRAEPAAPSVLTAVSGGGTGPAPAATPAFFGSAVMRIRIPSIDVDASVISLNINSEGNMDVPSDPELVAWYDFTPKPGLGGNAVFSGHVDWRNYGPAVFWDLDELAPGDDIEVVLADGTTIVYRVSATQTYSLDDLNMGEILAATPVESVTLITCEGSFSNGEYDSRRVVRAVRTAVLDGDT